MRQLTLVEPGRLEWLDVDEPVLRDGRDALVRPLAVATCDLDAPVIAGLTPYRPPIAIGHECVAVVAEAGDGGPAAGTLVSVPFQVSCGACERCRRGLTGNCESVPFLSMYGFGSFGGDWGGFLSDARPGPVRGPHACVPARGRLRGGCRERVRQRGRRLAAGGARPRAVAGRRGADRRRLAERWHVRSADRPGAGRHARCLLRRRRGAIAKGRGAGRRGRRGLPGAPGAVSRHRDGGCRPGCAGAGRALHRPRRRLHLCRDPVSAARRPSR